VSEWAVGVLQTVNELHVHVVRGRDGIIVRCQQFECKRHSPESSISCIRIEPPTCTFKLGACGAQLVLGVVRVVNFGCGLSQSNGSLRSRNALVWHN
jgi:hypothetical protein